MAGLAHAWRIHNAAQPSSPFSLERTLEHFISMDHKLGREPAAAANHFVNILAVMTMLSKWRKFMQARINRCSPSGRLGYAGLMRVVNSVKRALGLPDEILEESGFNAFNAEDGNYDEMTKRNECFSRIRVFTSTRSATQSGSASAGQNADFNTWRRVLTFGDHQWRQEPYPEQIPFWIDIPDPAQETDDGPPSAAKAMPRRPAPKPMPRPQTTSQRIAYVDPLPPIGMEYKFQDIQDYGHTYMNSRLAWVPMSEMFTLSWMQGPMANHETKVWGQYLRRTAGESVRKVVRLGGDRMASDLHCGDGRQGFLQGASSPRRHQLWHSLDATVAMKPRRPISFHGRRFPNSRTNWRGSYATSSVPRAVEDQPPTFRVDWKIWVMESQWLMSPTTSMAIILCGSSTQVRR